MGAVKTKKILIIEDDLTIAQVLAEKLGKEGLSVSQATDGQTGLTTALKEHPDLILLDIVLPQMDGLSALKKIRQDTWGRDVPVIMLTNLGDIKNIEAATADDVFDYLVKSDWSLDDVVKKVKTKLSVIK